MPFGLLTVRSRRTCARLCYRHLGIEVLESRTVPSVLTPSQIRHAYGVDQILFNDSGRTVTGDGSGQTIAIVDAYDQPNIASDLRYFSQAFDLPSSVFTKVIPEGQPAVNSGWALETALDVEWAHAIAPRANILLVEARTSSIGDLLGAVDFARRQVGVVAVSMSWGALEFSGEAYYDSYFLTPSGHGGVTFVASSGDNGALHGPEWPAISSKVLAVGGTHLNLATLAGTYGSETGWGGSGGGYSTMVGRPTYQYGFQSSSHRSNPDVAYDSDPNSGVYVYDSVTYSGYRGWFQVGGTSAGAPQWAALIAIADQGRALYGRNSLDGATQTIYALYQLAGSAYTTYYHDIRSGYNGYSAHVGYDLVTGLGSPKANTLVPALASYSGLGSPSGSGGSPGTASPTTLRLFAAFLETVADQSFTPARTNSAGGTVPSVPAAKRNLDFSQSTTSSVSALPSSSLVARPTQLSAIVGQSDRENLDIYDDQLAPAYLEGGFSAALISQVAQQSPPRSAITTKAALLQFAGKRVADDLESASQSSIEPVCIQHLENRFDNEQTDQQQEPRCEGLTEPPMATSTVIVAVSALGILLNRDGSNPIDTKQTQHIGLMKGEH